MIQDYVDIEV